MTALQLINEIEGRGGRITVESGNLVIEDVEIELPVLDSLRLHKPEIIALIQGCPADAMCLWLFERCAINYLCASSSSGLYLDFSRWCESRGWHAPARAAFVTALDDEGFTMAPAGFWLGLVLRNDMEAVLGGCA